MKKFSLLFIICFLVNACSFSSSPKEEVTSKPSDELEFAVDTVQDAVPEMAEAQPAANLKVEEEKVEVKPEEMRIVASSEDGKEQPMAPIEEPKFKDYKKDPVVAAAPEVAPMITEEAVQPFEHLGAQEKYHIQKGDTLMMVAFKIYGDYRKWKDLKAWNKGKEFGPGSVINYYVPERSFDWQPSGLPYMVKTGDTLGVISMDKYGTSKKWKSIYENNRPLIRNPNLIFAGFTIYYMPARDVASEHK